MTSKPFRERASKRTSVVGAGAAGITVAREVAAGGASVVLLEGGGLSPERDVQASYEGENVGQFYSLASSRLRYFGGSTNHWEGWCRPLDEADFQIRDWVPDSGWPIDRQELVPYWERAHEILDLGPFQYELPASVGPTIDLELLGRRFWRHSPPTRFNEKYRDEIQRSDRITCLLHANLLRFESRNAGRVVRHVVVGALGGATAIVQAQRFVVACGGIENARVLLLASERGDLALDGVAPRIGRFFMEHVFAPTATLVVNSDWWQEFQRFTYQGFDLTSGIAFGEAVQREHRILNLVGMVKAADCPPGIRSGHSCLSFLSVGEQAPNADSRVTLSHRTDALGLPVVKLEWRLTEIDRHTIETGTVLLARELGRLG